MSTVDPAAALVALATDLRAKTATLNKQIKAATPDGLEPTLYVGYLDVAADLVATVAREAGNGRLYVAYDLDELVPA